MSLEEKLTGKEKQSEEENMSTLKQTDTREEYLLYHRHQKTAGWGRLPTKSFYISRAGQKVSSMTEGWLMISREQSGVQR